MKTQTIVLFTIYALISILLLMIFVWMGALSPYAKFSIDSIEYSNTGRGMGYNASAGTKYAIVYITEQNIGDTSYLSEPADFKAIDNSGRVYFTIKDTDYIDYNFRPVELTPGAKNMGYVEYLIEDGATIQAIRCNSNNGEIYTIRIASVQKSGNTYIPSTFTSVTPVDFSSFYLFAWLILNAAPAIVIYRDSKRRGRENNILWSGGTLLFGILCAGAYAYVVNTPKSPTPLVPHPSAGQVNATTYYPAYYSNPQPPPQPPSQPDPKLSAISISAPKIPPPPVFESSTKSSPPPSANTPPPTPQQLALEKLLKKDDEEDKKAGPF